MSSTVIAAILAATFLTAAISGVFGMAGGLILMGVLTWLTPVAVAMVLHGAIQMVSNGSRAAFLWRHISWTVIGRYLFGVAFAVALLAFVAWRPSAPVVFILLGLTPMVVWLPKERFHLDAQKPVHAAVCGFLVQMLNTLAGVAGPLLDLFFVRTDMTRQTVVATKAATQVLAHAIKVVFWGAPLVIAAGAVNAGETAATFPSAWLFAGLIPLSLAGTWLGGRILERMTDASFRQWTKWIVTVIGVVYLVRGVLGVAA